MSGQKHGQEFETAINRQNRSYVRDGRAWCWHTFPPFILQQRLKGGRFIGRLMGEAPPDYLVFAAGQFFMIEAKSFKSARFSWANIHPHQARALSTLDEFDGAVAVLAIRSAAIGEVAFLRWSAVAEDWAQWRAHKISDTRAPSGAGSMAWGDLRARAVVVLRWPDCDYLEALTCKLNS